MSEKRNKIVTFVVGIIVGAIIGHFGTNEYRKYQIRSVMKEVGESFSNPFELSEKEIKEREKEEKEKQTWQYREKKDDMRDTVMHFAEINSISDTPIKSRINFDQPDIMTIIVRNYEGELAMMVYSTKHINCNKYSNEDSCSISVKKDNDDIIKFKFTESENIGNSVVFIEESEDFLKLVRNSKDLIIEAPLLMGGKKQYKFKPEGLVWDK